jgi:hypothetical protein
MSDKKKLTETENKDFTFTPSSEKTPSFSTKKTLEQIKKEEPSINVTVNSSQNSSAADINQNLGSFGNVVVQPEQQTTIETKKQESTPNVNETDVSIPDAKVDFAKFSKTKRNKSSTRFGTKIDI